jgi:hypothetical protein
MPVRRIRISGVAVTGIVPAQKAQGAAWYESTLEGDLLTLLEFHPEVVSFEAQPVSVPWVDSEGKNRSYTPDVLVLQVAADGRSRTLLYEVKPKEVLWRDWRELRPKFAAAMHFARSRGWIFKLATEDRIRTPMLASVRFLLPFRRYVDGDLPGRDALMAALHHLGRASVDALLARTFTKESERLEALRTVWTLVSTRVLGCDISKPISMETNVWLRGG